MNRVMVGTLSAVAGFSLGCFICGVVESVEPEQCVPSVPRSVVDGRVQQPFVTVYYVLGYAGKREKSGETCTAWRQVTEAEYEQRAYDDAG